MAPRPRPRTSRLIVLLLSVAIATGLATTVVSAAALPACRVADVTTAHRSYTDWARTILDTTYRLSSAYGPSDLRSTADAGLNGGQRVRRAGHHRPRAMATRRPRRRCAARRRVGVSKLLDPGVDLRLLGRVSGYARPSRRARGPATASISWARPSTSGATAGRRRGTTRTGARPRPASGCAATPGSTAS